MTPAEVITEVRKLIQDDHATITHRYSDATLLGHVNTTLKTMSIIRPDLFIYQGDITVTANQVEQALPSTAIRLMEIFRVKNGSPLREADRQTMDLAYPEWTTDTASTPENWMRNPRSPTKYFLWPPPSSGTILVGHYVNSPSDYALGDTISLPDAYKGVIRDGVVYLVESSNDEAIGTGRADKFFEAFAQILAAGSSQRATTDNEDADVNPEPGTRRRRTNNNGQ